MLAFLDRNMLVSPKRNCGVGGSKPTPGPNSNGFASQWNIGLRYFIMMCREISTNQDATVSAGVTNITTASPLSRGLCLNL